MLTFMRSHGIGVRLSFSGVFCRPFDSGTYRNRTAGARARMPLRLPPMCAPACDELAAESYQIFFYAERIAVVSDYRKNDGGLLSFICFSKLTIPATFAASDLELAYEKISCLICRVVRVLPRQDRQDWPTRPWPCCPSCPLAP